MSITDHLSIIRAIAQKDITNALKNLVMLSVAFGVFVLVGSSQMSVLLQQLSGYDVVFLLDTSGENLVYSPDLPSSLRLITVASGEELEESLRTYAGSSVGVTVSSDDSESLSVNVSYAHWVGQQNAINIIESFEQFLRTDFAGDVVVTWDDVAIFPEDSSNPMVNSMAIIQIIALFAFCGSLVPTLFIEEKRRKTWDVLLISPARISDILVGKAFAGMFYGIITASVTMLFYNAYILHWEVALLASLMGALLAVSTGLLLGVIVNGYQSINIYSAGLLFLLFLPLIPELLELNFADGVSNLLRLFPMPSLMTLIRAMYLGSISLDVIIISAIALLFWITGIGAVATWLASRNTS